MGYKIIFYIIDREFEDKYIYTGYFEKEKESFNKFAKQTKKICFVNSKYKNLLNNRKTL